RHFGSVDCSPFRYCNKFCHRLLPQYPDKMPQLILNVARHRHGVSNLLAQQQLVTLAKPVKRLLHCVLGHPKLAGNFSLRKLARFPGEQFFQPIEEPREKTLSKILGLLPHSALSSYEAINGSPVSAAKLLERRLCCWRWALRFHDHAPMRGGKRDRPVSRAWANPIP